MTIPTLPGASPCAGRDGPVSWLSDAVLYQIYPQSFADTDGDGVGDLQGVVERLDYLVWLGIDVIWLNPCFVSPFRDAGYDISDYLTVAQRYGTNDDLVGLAEAARRRGIRVLLDLVAGHTSDQHPWFEEAVNDPGDDRYIWAATPGPRFVASPGRRAGFYLKNFLACQPALNFGYARQRDDEPWRQDVDAPGPRRNRHDLREIMSHWLDFGVAGFRCDMAYSLVKDDPGFTETAKLWQELRGWLDRRHPGAALVAEWGEPAVSVAAGFHADFFLHFSDDAWRSLVDNGTGIVRRSDVVVVPFFDPAGQGSPRRFLEAWQTTARIIDGHGHAILPTSNHDFSRLACGPRTGHALKAVFAMQLTWPTLPAIYYGDEIGMRFLPAMPDKEGSRLGPGNNRAGSRSPMQWDDTATCGFSQANPERLYLPVDPDPARPNVAAQQADKGSLLNTVRRLIALRREHPGLGSTGALEVLAAGYPLVYTRAGRYLIAVNPRQEPADADVPNVGHARPLLAEGLEVRPDVIRVAGHGYGIFEI
jgi:maltose alpha-D-glucosyltransferase/alpha-amylase